MTFFLLIGIIFTLLIAGGGAAAWFWLGRRTDLTGGKQRHREEARRLQDRFESDEDFGRNFHRPTQNELLETLQALDHLTSDWENGETGLVEHRFKNELAASFPTLRKNGCAYPAPITEDLSRLFGKLKLSPTALDERHRSHDEKVAGMRAAFHAARAHANAMHQITSGPEIGPVAMTAGSLPFHVREESARRSGRLSWIGKLAVGAALLLGLAAAGWYFAMDDLTRSRALASIHEMTDIPVGSGGANAGKETLAINAPVAVVEPVPTRNVAVTVSSPSNSAAAPEPAPTAPIADPGTAPPVVSATSPVGADDTAQTRPAPPPTPIPVAALPSTPAPASTLSQQIAISQARAIDKYPDLTVPNSEMNLRFVFRYKKLADEKSPRLQDPLWPEKLADECAAAIAGPKGKKLTQTNPSRR